MARDSDTFSPEVLHGHTEATVRLFERKQRAVRNPAPPRGSHGATDRASRAHQGPAPAESCDAEIRRSIFDGRIASGSPHRSGQSRESDRKTCLSWQGKRVQITVSRFRDRSDAAVWEPL